MGPREIRNDLTEDQVIRLLILTYIKEPRDWGWLLNWATGAYATISKVKFSGGSIELAADPNDTETIVSGYENPQLWDRYKEDD